MPDRSGDDLDAEIAERTARNPDYPGILADAEARLAGRAGGQRDLAALAAALREIGNAPGWTVGDAVRRTAMLAEGEVERLRRMEEYMARRHRELRRDPGDRALNSGRGLRSHRANFARRDELARLEMELER